MKEIFISHTSEESALALELSSLIEESFPGACMLFVSSCPSDLPGGQQWMEALLNKLRSASVVIVLCSPQSMLKRWISFEAGGAWARGIPLIPICHSGMTKNSLPSPFNSFQAFNLLSKTFVTDFYASLARHLGCAPARSVEGDIVTRRINEALQRVKLYDLFISMPMTSYTDSGAYEESRGLVLSVIGELDACHGKHNIYCDAQRIACIEDTDTEQDSAETDLDALRRSKHFLLIYPQKVPSSCMVEAGYALALGIPSTYLVCNQDDLPYMLREVDQVHTVRMYKYRGKDDLLKIVKKIGGWIYPSA
jgi:hypothetical protein